MNILVSRCLLGEPCRYDGKSKPMPLVQKLEERGHTLIPVCPEKLGGLPTPRPPAELQPDGRVINRAGQDVTSAYRVGAEQALALARTHHCTLAILKAKSPSCGSLQRYNGTFTGTLVPGQGVAAALLTQWGVRVLDEDHLEELLV